MGPGNGQVLFPPRAPVVARHDGVFISTAYHYAMVLALHKGMLVRDIDTGMLVMTPQPERSS